MESQIEKKIASLKLQEKELSDKLHQVRLDIKRFGRLYQRAAQMLLPLDDNISKR